MGMDGPEGAAIKLPDDFSIMSFIDEYSGKITLSSIPNGTSIPAFTNNLRARVPDEAWSNHVQNGFVSKKPQWFLGDKILQETPVTFSGFFSHGQSTEDVRPRATVGIFPIFFEKASTMAM